MNRRIDLEPASPRLARRARVVMIAGHTALVVAFAAAVGAPYVWPAGGANAGALPGEVAVPANGARTASQSAPAPSIVAHVRLTGSLPGLIGARELLVSLPQGATVSILLNALSGAYPVVDVMGPNMLIAVDGESVAPAVLLHDGQVVDLVMPMAGG